MNIIYNSRIQRTSANQCDRPEHVLPYQNIPVGTNDILIAQRDARMRTTVNVNSSTGLKWAWKHLLLIHATVILRASCHSIHLLRKTLNTHKDIELEPPHFPSEKYHDGMIYQPINLFRKC